MSTTRRGTQGKAPLAIICVVGRSGAGKTTLLEHLIAEFRRRGYRVAAAKHAPHGFQADTRGKDSWRLLQAGAGQVLLSGPQGVVQFQPSGGDAPLEELAKPLEGRFDLLLAEGFKGSTFPKVEVHRAELGPGLLCSESQLFALVSDAAPQVAVPCFASSQVAELASFLEECFLRKPER
jgi:molybdopterin-guanine dinucleotide biosynthesis protein B